jgi:UDP-GlcNAc:undecaprenyl-phosphate GlcNAc-1-phosphate transferase
MNLLLAAFTPKYTLWEVLEERWWIAMVAFTASLLATPVFRYIAYHTKVVDRPDDLLKPHARPIAYLGGLGICLGLIVGLGVYLPLMHGVGAHWQSLRSLFLEGHITELPKNPLWNFLAIGAAFVVITLVGLLDDLRDIRPRQKVAGQVLAAGILLIGGVGSRMVVTVFSPLRSLTIRVLRLLPAETADTAYNFLTHTFGSDWVILPLSALACIVVVISACNATNLLDGLDGLCGGVTGIIALGFLALAVYLATYSNAPHEGTDEVRVCLSLAMAGAIFGFLPYNIPPASIFMGDAGSMLLGFYVATMMALFCDEGPFRWFLASCVIFALPILDTGLAVVRRLRAGVSIFSGDRSHLYDQLVDRGMSVKQVVVLFYAMAVLTAVMGVFIAVHVRTLYAVLLYAVLLVMIITIFAL